MITTKTLTILALTASAALSLSGTLPTDASAHGFSSGAIGGLQPGRLAGGFGGAVLGPNRSGPIGRIPPGRLAGGFGGGRIIGRPVPGPNHGHPNWGGGYWGGYGGYGYGYGSPVTYSTPSACPVGFFLNYWGHCRPLPY